MGRGFFTSIGYRLIAGFAGMIVLLLAAGVVGGAGMIAMRRSFEQSLDVGFTANDLTEEAKLAIRDAVLAETRLIADYQQIESEAERQVYRDEVTAALDELTAIMDAITALEADLPPQAQTDVADVERYTRTYVTGVDTLVWYLEQLGTPDNPGAIAELESAAADLESILRGLNGTAIQVLYQRVRFSEKAYLLTHDQASVDANRQAVEAFIAHTEELTLTDGRPAALANLAQTYGQRFAALVSLQSQLENGIGTNRALESRVFDALDRLEVVAHGLLESQRADVQDLMRSVLNLLLLTMAVGLVLGVALSAGITRSITGPLSELMRTAQQISAGDLDQRVAVYRRDELGRLAAIFNRMTDNLRQMIRGEVKSRERLESTITTYVSFVRGVADGDLTTRLPLEVYVGTGKDDLYILGENLNGMVDSLAAITRQAREAAENVAAVASELLVATTQQAATVAEENAAVTQTMATVEEVRSTVHQTADRAQEVAEAAQESVAVSYRGQEAVGNALDGMTTVQERVNDIATAILTLSARTQQIGEIIETVNKIADRSKLLALNASIEAARAGEEGKGFAVVAMEVRQLAAQSRQATARIGDILQEIQQTTNTAVMVTEEGSKGAAQGMALAERAGESIEGLTAFVEEAAQAVMQIAAATNQQINGMDQLTSAMQAIKQSSVESAASTRQAESGARNLTDLSENMQDAVSRYQL